MQWYLDDGISLTRIDVARDATTSPRTLRIANDVTPAAPSSCITSDTPTCHGTWEIIAEHDDIIVLRNPANGAVLRGVCERRGATLRLRHGAAQSQLTPHRYASAQQVATAGGAARNIVAPLPGRIVALNARVGDTVTTGQSIIIIEAMKMQNELCATCDGSIREIHVAIGHNVESGTLLVSMT